METLGVRLKKLRMNRKLTQQKLADKIGVSKTSIIYWERDENIPKHESLNALSVVLGASVDYLVNGTESKYPKIENMNYKPPVDDDISPPKLTPVISWVQAGDFTAVVSTDLSHVIEWIPYNPRAGVHGFALIVKGASMEPEFKASEYVYINPTYQIDELNTGALVVMACDGDSEATFKELVAEGGKYYLRALNPDWHEKIMPIDHTCRLVGKVVGKYVNY